MIKKNKKIIVCDLGLIEYEKAWQIQKDFHKKRTIDEISHEIGSGPIKNHGRGPCASAEIEKPYPPGR